MIYCCKEHVEEALEKMLYKTATSPSFEMLEEEKSLSTTCEYCRNHAIYVVSN